MARVVVAGAMLLVTAFAAAAADPGPDNLVLSCAGAFAADSSRERLAAVFGAANVADVEIDVGEGMTEPGTVLFPDDPMRRVDIFWHDGDARARPLSVLVRGDDSLWVGPLGVRLGSSLAEVEAVNGGPFDILGFDWDQGGYVPDWRGKLATATGAADCPFSARFGPTSDGYDAVGDQVFSSAAAGIRAGAPVVEMLSIGWAQPR